MVVVNLFAYRATDWRELLTVTDPVGPENVRYINYALATSRRVMVAWGAHADHKGLAPRVRAMVKELAKVVPYGVCVGRTASGQPRHPLMVRKDALFEEWKLPTGEPS